MSKKSRRDYEMIEIKLPKHSVSVLKQAVRFLEIFLPKTLAKRFVAIILLAIGIPVKIAVELSGLSERSLWTIHKQLSESGISEIMVFHYGGGCPGKTAGLEGQILAEIEANNYHTRQDIADFILEKFNVKVSRTSVGRLLKKNGIKWLKCGSLPAKADIKKQNDYFESTLKPLMEKAKSGDTALLFLDASHFVMGCDFLGHIYGKTRRLVRTFSGRRRYNVLGALDYVSKKIHTVTNDTYITATEVCAMLRQIAFEYKGLPVHLVLDNARYQKCAAVQELAEELGIALEYIPPYSPNLNLIERVWKFTKGELRSKYYGDFDSFREKIDSTICSTSGSNKSKIDKLIGKGIQLFHDTREVDNNTFSCTGRANNAA